MEMITITVEMVRNRQPCYDPTRIVPEDWTGTVLDVFKLDISVSDMFWLALCEDVLPKPLLSEFIRWCALQVVDLWNAPDVVVQFLNTGNEELRDAAYATARLWLRAQLDVATRDAVYAAIRAIAYGARDTTDAIVYPAARVAAWAAANAVMRSAVVNVVTRAAAYATMLATMQKQLEKLINMIEAYYE